ncbi:MAG: chemotaxis protein CheW [Planctomycetaceae bacterium]|nr:chemotaxis protein CheW [Planctomycetaceae bacterium]
MSATATRQSNTATNSLADCHQFVSFLINGELLGVPVSVVQEVLTSQQIAATPLARPEVAGLLNLRGQIVTAVNLRRRLGLPDLADGQPSMNVVVRHHGESFSLLVDDVGDVISVDGLRAEPPPRTLDARWRSLVSGVMRLDEGLFVILDLAAVLSLDGNTQRSMDNRN